MPQTLMPRDAHNQAIQTLAPAAPASLAIQATSTRTASDFTSGVKIVELRPTVACFIKFGDGAVTATADGNDSFYLHAAERVTYHIGTKTRLAAIRQSTDGVLYITELA